MQIEFPRQIEFVLAVPFYWVQVFWDAIVQTWSLIVGQRLAVSLVAGLVFFLGLGLHASFFGRDAVVTDLRPSVSGAVAVCIVAFLVFVGFLVTAPYRLHRGERERAINAENQLHVFNQIKTEIEAKIAAVDDSFSYLNVVITNRGPEDRFSIHCTIVGGDPIPPRLHEPFTLIWLNSSEVTRTLRRDEPSLARFGTIGRQDDAYIIDFNAFEAGIPELGKSLSGNFTRQTVPAGASRNWDLEFRVVPAPPGASPFRYKLHLNNGDWSLVRASS